MKAIYHTCRGLAAIILLQTLFFKFTGAEESVYIFTKVGAEPFGRIGSGIVELIAAVLLFVVRRAKQGASYQVKDLLFQNLASRNYRVLQSC